MIDRIEGSARAIAWIAALGLLAATGAVRAADDETSRIVRHKVIVDCDGEDADCGERVHKIVIDAGDGEGLSWVAADGDNGWMPRIRIGDGAFAFGPLMGGGFLGVGLTEMTPELRGHFGVPEDSGVLISKVVAGSPAAAAGLAVGDIVTRVDGEEVASGHQLAHAIRSKEAGETATLEVWRNGEVRTLTAVVEAHEVPGPLRKRVVVCPDDQECDAPAEMLFLGRECPDGEACEIEVRCDGDDCDCTLNGDSVDCSTVERD